MAEKKGDGLVMLGLALGVLLYALDQTIVGTSLGRIVEDVGGFRYISWLFAAYMLASTAVIPVAGKLSDLFGRRPLFLAGMGVFLLGSALCGLATTMPELILYRGVQGLGGGVIFPVALATVADLYPPNDRGRAQGAFGAVFGLASVLGPFLGGWIVDNVHLFDVASWRWTFYVNLPVGLVGMAIVAIHFPRLPRRTTPPLDWLGMATLSLSLVSGLLVTVWGGDTYAWDSPEVLGTLAFSALMLVAFVFVELRAADPVVPLSLFREPIFAWCAALTLFLGVGMFGILAFVPTYMQAVVGMSATNSGAVLTPLMLGMVGGSVASGLLAKRTGYKVYLVTGSALVVAGYVLLASLGGEPSIPTAVLYMVLVGVGLGFTIQMPVLAVQNVVERRLVGAATSGITLARSLGGTVGVTVLGVLLNRGLRADLPRVLPPGALDGLLATPLVSGKIGNVPSLLLLPQFTATAPPGVVEAIRSTYSTNMTVVFLASAAIAAFALVASFFVRSLRLKDAAAFAAPAPRAVAALACALCAADVARKVRYKQRSTCVCGNCYFTRVPAEARVRYAREAP